MMAGIRETRAKRNVVVTLLLQLITLLCGLVVPKMTIDAFGSEAYGAAASITQFLSYIALLEGGIGGVARAALYKPLAENDRNGVSSIVGEIKRFFTAIGCVFAVYVAVLSCTFTYIADVRCFDRLSTFCLVWVISVSTFIQYFIGISNAVLLQAAQKTYITNAVSIFTLVLNAVLVFVCIAAGSNLITVKLVSGLVFALKPVMMWAYVRRVYRLTTHTQRTSNALEQKWTGLGQHVAFFLHTNTDIVVLTVFADLKQVAVYSVYYMIVSHIQSLTTSFCAGMEASFGEMLAKKEHERLDNWFGYYETLLSLVSLVMFSVTAVMLLPFVALYTSGVTDADYIQPLFGILLTVASLVYCLRLPYHAMTVAAGHFKQTRVAAYGEAALNIVLSIVLVYAAGLSGVAAATLIATVFRLVYYAVYLSKHILQRPVRLFVKRAAVNASAFILSCGIGLAMLMNVRTDTYREWVLFASAAVVLAVSIVFAVYLLFYRDDVRSLWRSAVTRFRPREGKTENEKR